MRRRRSDPTLTPGYKLFLAHLVKARTDRGLSIDELAGRLNLPPSIVQSFESGQRFLDFVQTRTWCAALEVPFTEFVLALSDDMNATLDRDEPIDDLPLGGE